MRLELQIGAVAGGLAVLVMVAVSLSTYQGTVAAVWMFGGALSLLFVVSGGAVRPWATSRRGDPPSPGPVSSFAAKVEGGAKGVGFFQAQIAGVVASSGVPLDGVRREFLEPREEGENLKGEAYLAELEAALRGGADG